MSRRCTSTLYANRWRCILEPAHVGHHSAARDPKVKRDEALKLGSFDRVWWTDRPALPGGPESGPAPIDP